MTQYQVAIECGKAEGVSSKFSWKDVLTNDVFEIVLPLYGYQWNIADQNNDFIAWACGRIIKRNIQ